MLAATPLSCCIYSGAAGSSMCSDLPETQERELLWLVSKKTWTRFGRDHHLLRSGACRTSRTVCRYGAMRIFGMGTGRRGFRSSTIVPGPAPYFRPYSRNDDGGDQIHPRLARNAGRPPFQKGPAEKLPITISWSPPVAVPSLANSQLSPARSI